MLCLVYMQIIYVCISRFTVVICETKEEVSRHDQLVNSTLITTSNSVPIALDQEPAINSYHLITLTIHTVIPIFTLYHIYGTLCLLLT